VLAGYSLSGSGARNWVRSVYPRMQGFEMDKLLLQTLENMK